MEDTLISFETAKLAKEKGFYQFTNIRKVFDNGSLKRKPSMGTGTWSDFGNRYLPAPTQSLLQKWLREVHKIECYAYPYQDHADDNNDTVKYRGYRSGMKMFNTFEEALENDLQKALKSITLIK